MSPSISLRLLRTQSDGRLVELARDGHERAFEALVARYRRPLLGYCRRMLLPESRAEDALQQGLLQAWLALCDGCEVRDAKAWLFRIVHNAAISARRRSGYDYVELDESLHASGAPDGDIDRRIAVREALAGLAALPEAQREVLLRTAVHGHSHEQVAAELGLSDGAVRGLIYRARATLRAGVTALTPPQLVVWAARAAESGSAHPQLAELVGTAGSAGGFGLLLKGGAVVLSAGVLASGVGIVAHSAGSSSARADRTARYPREAQVSAPANYFGGRLSTTDATPIASSPGMHESKGSARARPAHQGRHGRGGGSVSSGSGQPGGRDGRSRGSGGGDGASGATGGEPGVDGGAHGSGPGPGGSGDHHTGASSGDGAPGQAGAGSESGTHGNGGGSSGDGGSPAGSASVPAPTQAAPAEQPSGGDGRSGGGSGGGTSGSSSGDEAPAGSMHGH